MENTPAYSVAVIGAGPAGLYAAQELVRNGVRVVLFNRDIKPGGLAEYGVYPDKYRLRDGFRAAFWQILDSPEIDYFGNVLVHQDGNLPIEDIWKMGFQAVLVTVGAQGTKWLGLPGEDLKGVYHAKDLVYHYNKLPPFGQKPFYLGKKVAIIGVGNVMMDIAHYMITRVKSDEVIAVARRGPGEVKFDKAELEFVSKNIDLKELRAEIDRLSPSIAGLSEAPDKPLALIESVLPKALQNESKTRFTFRFLLSPVCIHGNGAGEVSAVEFEENKLVRDGETIMAMGTGKRQMLDVDTVVFAIGDCVDEALGLPVYNYEFVKNPSPSFPVDGNSYEAYDNVRQKALEGVFVAGWARRSSTGLVGITRRDGINGARALLKYLATQPEKHTISIETIRERLAETGQPVVTKADLICLQQVEKEKAAELGLPEFKFDSHEEMLNVISRCTAGVY